MSDDAHHTLAAEIRALLGHLIELALLQDETHAAEARRRALVGHSDVRAHAHPSLLAGLAIDGLWDKAKHDAETPALAREPLRVSMALPSACPLRLADLTAPQLDADALADRIRGTAATG